MIVEEIRKSYEAEATKKISKGNPTGSRFGTCAAQSQMLLHPRRYKSEPPRARNIMTWEEGDRVEEWWSEAIERVFPRASGLAQVPFYFPVPVSPEEADTLADRIRSRALWGTVEAGFKPPAIREGEDGRVKISGLRWDTRDRERPAPLGFVVDPTGPLVWAPTYVDRVIKHPVVGVAVLEKKSMSNYAFRRALLGDLDYGKRCQLAGMAAATGLSVCLLAYRKETAHLCELLYTQKAERARVQITTLNGKVETYFTQPGSERVLTEAGEETDLPGDALWDTAATWTPFEPMILEQIRARVRRVLLFDGAPERLYREYGPSFGCKVCDGTGTQTLAKAGRTPLKKPKPCEDCSGTGRLEEVELTFPCTYCGVAGACYPFARLELDSKPHLIVRREDYEKSGLTFTPPEPNVA